MSHSSSKAPNTALPRRLTSRGVEPRLERDVGDGFHQPQDDVPTALAHPDDRRGLGGARAAARLALAPSAPAAPPVLTTAGGWPWYPATRATAAPATWARPVGGCLDHQTVAPLTPHLRHVRLLELACVGHVVVREGAAPELPTQQPPPQG